MIRPKRPHMPLLIKLHAALLALGLDPRTVEFDHDPALEFRPLDAAGNFDPPANDPRYIVPRSTQGHHRKTFGDHVPLSGDLSKIAKVKRIEKKEAAFRDRLLGVAPRGERPPKPKRKIQSRPGWPKRGLRK